MGQWRWVRKVTPEFDAHWRDLFLLTGAVGGLWLKLVQDYAAQLKREITVADLERAILANDPFIVIDRLSWHAIDKVFVAAATPVLLAALTRAGVSEAIRLNLAMTFDLQNPYVQPWIEAHAAELVSQVTAETKQAIRAVIADAFNRGLPPRKAALAMRNLVGLTEKDAKTVMRYWQTVTAEGNRTAQAANALADKYAQKLLQRRADLIARTEIVTSANAGVQSSWRQAQSEGFLLPTTLQEWIAAVGSPRTCAECIAMDGQRVPVGEPFISARGPVSGPALHPNCRCAVSLYTPIPA